MDCNNFKACVTELENSHSILKSCPLTQCLLSYDDRPMAVVEENKKKYALVNRNRDKIARFQIDDGMISSQNIVKCDNLVIDTDSKFAVFVELKGTDLKHAFVQVDETVTRLLSGIPGYRIYARIVTSNRTNVPNIKACPQYVALSKKIMCRKGNVVVHSGVITDDAVTM